MNDLLNDLLNEEFINRDLVQSSLPLARTTPTFSGQVFTQPEQQIQDVPQLPLDLLSRLANFAPISAPPSPFSNSGPFSTVTFTAELVSTMALQARIDRKYLLIQNNGLNPIYVNVGSDASSTAGIHIPGGGNWEPYRVPTNDIYIAGAVAGTQVTLMEGF